jgi:hypothetical protein
MISRDADDVFDVRELGSVDPVAIDLCMHSVNANGKSLNDAPRLYLQAIDPTYRGRCGGRVVGGVNSGPCGRHQIPGKIFKPKSLLNGCNASSVVGLDVLRRPVQNVSW